MSQLTTKVFPDGSTFRPFQPKLISLLNAGKRALELWYGGGKSLIAIEWALSLPARPAREYGECLAVVFCKPRNLITWKLEMMKRYPEITVLTDLPDAPLSPAPKVTTPFYIIAYPHSRVVTLEERIKLVLNVHRPRCLILDESTAIKNPDTKLAIALHSIRTMAPIPALAMTGNMIPEGLHEIWSQFQFAYGRENPLGDSFYRFRKRWFVDSGFGWSPDQSKITDLRRILVAHTATLDAETMPMYQEYLAQFNVMRTMEIYEDTAEQRRLLKYLEEQWALPRDTDPTLAAQIEEVFVPSLEALSADIELEHAISLLQKRQQIASGFYYDDNRRPVYLKHNPKLDQLREVISTLLTEDPQRQIIIWSAFKAERPPIIDMLTDDNIRVVETASEESLKAFNGHVGSRAQVAILSPKQSHGLNELRNADVAIFYSNVYSQELRNQAESRNTGARQAHPRVTLIDMCGTNQLDMSVVVSLQAKNFSINAARALVNQFTGKKDKNKNEPKGKKELLS